MKHISNILIFVWALSVGELNAQSIQNPSNALQLSHEFDSSQRRLTFHADNQDYCEYYLLISFLNAEGFSGMSSETPAIVYHGQRQILSYRVDENAKRYSYNYRYAFFRGNPNKKINIDFAYSLPVANEETVTVGIRENREGYQLDFELPADTVLACRSGVVCDDELKDHTSKGRVAYNDNSNMSQITIYHKDGTFGEYVFKGKPLFYPGQYVNMGDAIAIIQKDITDKYSVRFAAYFLDKNKVRDKKVGNKHTHFRPFFQVSGNGKVRLESGKSYTCELTDQMLVQDMSKREQKKFLQKKGGK